VAAAGVQTLSGDPVDLWLPLVIDPASTSQVHYFTALGRLAPGVALSAVNSRLAVVAEQFRRDFPNAVAMGPVNYSPTRKQNVFGVNAGTVGSGQNVFVNPDAAFALFRNPILGLDGQVGGGGPLRGLAYWNLDMAFSKNVKLTERFNSTVYGAFTNVLNHMQAADPAFSLSDPTTFGVLGGGGNVQANQPRHLEIGMRLNW